MLPAEQDKRTDRQEKLLSRNVKKKNRLTELYKYLFYINYLNNFKFLYSRTARDQAFSVTGRFRFIQLLEVKLVSRACENYL